MPKRSARLAASTIPASATARSSSKLTAIASSPTGPSACTMKVTSCAGPGRGNVRQKHCCSENASRHGAPGLGGCGRGLLEDDLVAETLELTDRALGELFGLAALEGLRAE